MFDWVKYLVLAEELAERHNDEAALRSAVSRAYYAAFGTARARLRAEGFQVPRRAPHQFVWTTYQRSAELDRVEIGVKGFRLKEFRVAADYSESLVNLSETVVDSVQRAKRLINSLRELHPKHG